MFSNRTKERKTQTVKTFLTNVVFKTVKTWYMNNGPRHRKPAGQ